MLLRLLAADALQVAVELALFLALAHQLFLNHTQFTLQVLNLRIMTLELAAEQ